MLKVTAVIPAYNEAARIAHTINQARPFVDEIIVIDDTSTDRTASLAKKQGVYRRYQIRLQES